MKNKIELHKIYKKKDLQEFGINYTSKNKERTLNTIGKWYSIDSKGNIGQGTAVVFTEVFEVQKEKEDNRGKTEGSRGNNTLEWTNEGKYLLLEDLITKFEKGQKTSTNTILDWCKIMNVVNDNLKLSKRKENIGDVKLHLFKNYNTIVDISEISMFMNNTYNVRKSNLVSILSQLNKANILQYRYTVKYREYERDENNKKIQDKDGNYILKNGYYIADNERAEQIQAIERAHYMDLGFYDKAKVIHSPQCEMFYAKVSDHLEKVFNMAKYYFVYEVNVIQGMFDKKTTLNQLRIYQDSLRKVRRKNKETGKMETIEVVTNNQARDLANKKAKEQLLKNSNNRVDSLDSVKKLLKEECMIDMVTNQNAKIIHIAKKY